MEETIAARNLIERIGKPEEIASAPCSGSLHPERHLPQVKTLSLTEAIPRNNGTKRRAVTGRWFNRAGARIVRLAR